MTAIQCEYLCNARKAVRVANAVKFNAVAYGHQIDWAEAHWRNYLRSSGAKRMSERVTHLRLLLTAKNTQGALKYLSM